jgi:hypothetical protein
MSTLQIDDREWDLSRAEFADAIAKGLGRAFLYVKNHGLDRVKDLVLTACLDDLSYDRQCDTSRAEWLFAMFADSPHYSEFRDKILAALFIESDLHEPYQLCELAAEMALKGDAFAMDTLEKYVYDLSAQPMRDEYWSGANQLIRVRGIDAALELSRIFGRRLLANPEDPVPPGWYLDFFEDISEETSAIFERYSAAEESIVIYYQYLIDTKRENDRKRAQRNSQPKTRASIQEIIELAQTKKREYLHVYRRFGSKATAAELATIFELLQKEPDEDICLRLLWIFMEAPMPRLVDRIFDWLDSPDTRLKTATFTALSQISDDRVYRLGRSRLATGLFVDDDGNTTLDLFINNYHSGDAELILASLKGVEIDCDDLHSIGFTIVDISKKQNNPELVSLLRWIYDCNPCAICREHTVKQLQKYDRFEGELLAEYQYDSRQFEQNSID